MDTPETGADDVRWALDDLYDDPDALQKDLASLEADATGFAEQYRGRIENLDPEALAEALDSLGSLQDRLGRAHAYAHLYWTADTNDAERGALRQSVQETVDRIQQRLVFFDTEWVALDAERVEELLAHEPSMTTATTSRPNISARSTS
jgi:Oligoendopeptidase F